ncbi:Lrp/AsnC family transcriptional regulator [Gimibacter soli]|uniref:Lrp/AsnC family transcriptional regulator n=1 Tax=Gimibacter soli TaxID=3024400 RepID=A0AAF0BMY6_9PROT|nr:Lrp/AsnC family transcriptional regulator [Gimibacter soli]WCL55245.1 Lrp/AsnC family transcriptional regulator [Gimibacter soli]
MERTLPPADILTADERAALVRLIRDHVFQARIEDASDGSPTGLVRQFVQRLKRKQAFKGWRPVIDREKIGLPVTAFIAVKLKSQHHEMLSSYSRDLMSCSDVAQVHMVSGKFDFLVEFWGRDLAQLEAFRRTYVNGHPAVSGTETMISYGRSAS